MSNIETMRKLFEGLTAYTQSLQQQVYVINTSLVGSIAAMPPKDSSDKDIPSGLFPEINRRLTDLEVEIRYLEKLLHNTCGALSIGPTPRDFLTGSEQQKLRPSSLAQAARAHNGPSGEPGWTKGLKKDIEEALQKEALS